MHPTPKSREGVDLDALLACSPEVGACFALHWFRVDPALVRHQGNDPRDTLRQLSGGDDLYPCHPWEVQRILAGDCSVPVGVRTEMSDAGLKLIGILFEGNGTEPKRAEAFGADPETVARELCAKLRS